jgi:predicted metalloendopeptidase
MKNYTIRKLTNIKNKTIKKKNSRIKSQVERLPLNQRNSICKTITKRYNTFEDKVEELFKKNSIDFLSANYNLEKEILNNLKKAVSPSNINPQNDFYSYINDRWLKDYELATGQEYIVQVDDFRIVQDKVYRELHEIIQNYLDDAKNKNTKKYNCIKNAFTACRKYNTQYQQQHDAKSIVELFDEIRKNKNNLWKMLALINKNEIISWGCPFVWTLNPDEKNPKVYKCYLDAPQVTLIDLDLYFDDGTEIEYKKNYRNEYFKYLKKLFENAFGPNHNFNIKDVFDCEVKIINNIGCDLIKQTDEDLYNLITKDEALTDFGFNWEEFSKELGFDDVPKDFVTSNVNYLLCGTKLLLDEWDSPQWRTYWVYIYIRQQQRWSKKGKLIFYDFQGKFVRGQAQPIDISVYEIFSMGFLFNTFLTNEYISKYKNDETINYVKTMAEDLKTVFTRIIKRNKWLEPKTKEKALSKLYNLNLEVGSPKILRADPLLNYSPDDPWGNLVKSAEWRNKEAIKLNGKPVIDIPVIDWSTLPPKFIGTQAYVVNAYYMPSKNGIYIPLGYIQKPFIDLDERGVEYNLARIGFTIAHEMSHALDDRGSKYDELGVLNNWWSKKDKTKFEAIQKDVVNQYEKFASNDGLKFDAWPSIGEDLADISGLTICREYLRDFQLKNEDILPIQKISFEAFFIYFAVQQRQKLSKNALSSQLKSNPHPLDKYRTNVPLSRLPIFRSIFNVVKGDKMWWHTTNRIWEE